MLWLHSAAWMAFEVFAAEHARVSGHLPLLLGVAGSRVAMTEPMRAVDNPVKARKKSILGGQCTLTRCAWFLLAEGNEGWSLECVLAVGEATPLVLPAGPSMKQSNKSDVWYLRFL